MSPNGRRSRVTAVPVTKQARRSISNRPKVVGLVHKFRSRLKNEVLALSKRSEHWLTR